MKLLFGVLLLVGCSREQKASSPLADPTPPPPDVVFVPANQDLLLDEIDHEDCSPRRDVNRKASHADFWIDRDTVSCTNYRRCVAAGRCDRMPWGCLDRVRVTQSEANVYCAWQGAHLASYVEWMGAQYQGGTILHAQRDYACSRDAFDLGWPRCTETTQRGFVYTVESRNYGEWTSELGCVEHDSRLHYMAIAPRSQDWFFAPPVEARYEFRCAGLAKP